MIEIKLGSFVIVSFVKFRVFTCLCVCVCGCVCQMEMDFLLHSLSPPTVRLEVAAAQELRR